MVSPEMGRKLTGRVEAWRSAAQKREDAPDGNRAEPKLNPRQRAPCHLPRHPAHLSRESVGRKPLAVSVYCPRARNSCPCPNMCRKFCAFSRIPAIASSITGRGIVLAQCGGGTSSAHWYPLFNQQTAVLCSDDGRSLCSQPMIATVPALHLLTPDGLTDSLATATRATTVRELVEV